MKGFKDSDGKFRPISTSKGTRKKSDKTSKTTGKQITTGIRKKGEPHISPELVNDIRNLQRTLRPSLEENGFNGTMAYWSELKGECQNVVHRINQEKLETTIITRVPESELRKKLDTERLGVGAGNSRIGGTAKISELNPDAQRAITSQLKGEFLRLIRMKSTSNILQDIEIKNSDRWMLDLDVTVKGGILGGDVRNLEDHGWRVDSINSSNGNIVFAVVLDRTRYRA